MKKYTYILLSVILLFTACKEPNPTEPDTTRDINDKVEYQIIDQTELGFESEVFTELVIRDEQKLKESITKNSTNFNLDLVDKLLKVELEKDVLVIISGKAVAEIATIRLDTIYLDNSGQIQIDYSIYRKIGINSRVSSPTLAILIKNRKEAVIRFNRRYENDGEVPTLDDFKTIGEDIPSETERKWKSVFNDATEFKKWATEYKINETGFVNEVDFDKEMVLSVGANRFQSGIHNYRITDVKQQGGRIIVNSVFEMQKAETYPSKKSNHFVKIKKTGLPIYFNPTLIVNNVFPGSKFYHENYRMMSIETSEKTAAKVTKVSSLSELFSVYIPSDEMSPSNVEVDWEFFDLLIIKAPTTTYKGLKYELDYLKRDDWGIKGKIVVIPSTSNDATNYDNYIFIKVLKTNIPISKNFEVIVK